MIDILFITAYVFKAEDYPYSSAIDYAGEKDLIEDMASHFDKENAVVW